jgi:hypothetical protein
MPLTLPAEVFLSHSNHDRNFVDSLANAMRAHGVPVWYSQMNILGAQQWHDEIGAALRRCDWFAVILSPQSVRSEWVKHELMFTFRHNRFRNRIVPILYQDCDVEELSWMLPDFQMIDFTGSFPDGCANLFRVWGLGYRE